MSIIIKSPREIELIRKSCHILGEVHSILAKEIKAGMSTWDLDAKCEEVIRSYGCVPNFKNYAGFPASACISINEEVVHGIPSKDKIINEGDIVSLDLGCIYEGYHSDAARTVGVGEISEEARLLIERTRESFFAGILRARAGNHLHQISNAIADVCEGYGYGVVRDLVGHGVGCELHEDPQIPNFHTKTRGVRLRPGMTLAIEPMVNAGTWEVECLDNDWTFVTLDGSLSAHYENSILITDGDPEILTLTPEEKEEFAGARGFTWK